MRRTQYTLTRSDVHRHTHHRLQHHLRLTDYSRKCTSRVLLSVVLLAAACLTSLAAACARLAKAPSDETLRKALLATLPGYAELLRRLNRALAADLPKALRRRRQRLAIDLTLIPYHGLPFEKASEIYRSQAKSGTSHFHAYATLCIVRKGYRFTVAFTPVSQGEKLADVLQRLLKQAGRVGVKPRLLLLDRGFYQVGVIRYLQAARYPFLMPVACRGRQADHPKGPSGSNVFRSWKRGGWDSHTLTDAQGRKATVSIAVRCRNRRSQRQPKRRQPGRQRLVYAFWGFRPGSLEWVRQTYRQRFGIETSYRQMNEARIRTSSRNPLVRLFYVGVALLLRNVWVWLHGEVLSSPQRGGRRLNLHRLRLKTLLGWLQQVIEDLLGVRESITTERRWGV